MKLSELVTLADGDPELMIDGPDGWPVPITSTDIGVMHIPGTGTMPYLLLSATNEEGE